MQTMHSARCLHHCYETFPCIHTKQILHRFLFHICCSQTSIFWVTTSQGYPKSNHLTDRNNFANLQNCSGNQNWQQRWKPNSVFIFKHCNFVFESLFTAVVSLIRHCYNPIFGCKFQQTMNDWHTINQLIKHSEKLSPISQQTDDIIQTCQYNVIFKIRISFNNQHITSIIVNFSNKSLKSSDQRWRCVYSQCVTDTDKINPSINQLFYSAPKSWPTGQLSLPHLGITKTEKKNWNVKPISN